MKNHHGLDYVAFLNNLWAFYKVVRGASVAGASQRLAARDRNVR
jgi:hypothetical protein